MKPAGTKTVYHPLNCKGCMRLIQIQIGLRGLYPPHPKTSRARTEQLWLLSKMTQQGHSARLQRSNRITELKPPASYCAAGWVWGERGRALGGGYSQGLSLKKNTGC